MRQADFDTSFPTQRVIHLIWISPENTKSEIPSDIDLNIRKWCDTHDDFNIRVWSAPEILSLRSDEVLRMAGEATKICRFVAMRADIMRLMILYSKGGVYSDLKNKPLRRFLDPFFESDKVIISEHAPTIKNYQGRLMNSFFFAPQGSAFIRAYLERICSNVLRRTGSDVASVTGAGPLAQIMKERRDLHEYSLIESSVMWGETGRDTAGFMTRTSASYNGKLKESHWSIRQKNESLYLY